MHGLPSVVERLLDGRVGPVEPLVALFLPPFGGHVLVEVALRIHEADADERHAEVARFLAVIAGQDAETAGVDRQRLMQRELGREVRDRLPGQLRQPARPPGVVGRACIVERGDGPVVQAHEVGVAGGGLELLVRHGPEHAHRVVGGRSPQRVVEPAEHLARVRVPAPPEIGGELVQAVEAIGQRSQRRRICSWGRCAPTSDESGKVDVTARHDGDDLAPAGSSAERGGDRAAGRALRDHVRAFGHQAHGARHVVQRHDDRAGKRRTRAATSMSRTDLPPAPSTNEAFQPIERHGAAGLERGGQRRRRVRLGGEDARRRPGCADRGRDPGKQSAAAERRHDGVDVGEILEDLEPDRAVARDEPVVVERMHEGAGQARSWRGGVVITVCQHSSYEARTIVAPSRSSAWILVSGAVSMTRTDAFAPTIRAANATPSAALPALTVQTPPRELGRRELPDDVEGAADLERSDGLQHFELEVELVWRSGHPGHIDPHERCPHGGAVDGGGRIANRGRIDSSGHRERQGPRS